MIYLCYETALGRNVAVKVLPSHFDEDSRERFLREGYAMGGLSGHPNIVNILRVGVTDYGETQLSDFGIAHIEGGYETATGFFSGTIDYTAPEGSTNETPSPCATCIPRTPTESTLSAPSSAGATTSSIS